MNLEWTAEESDHELVRRCQSTDPRLSESAFLEVYERYRDRVYNTALRVLGNSADAADVTQEVFFSVYRKIAEFQFSSRVFTWIYRITVNLSIDRKRRDQASPTIVTDGGQEGGALALVPDERNAQPDSWADAEYLEQKVQLSINRLSPKLRAIVVLRYIEGLSYGDIAEILECSVGTVKSRLNRAHRSLESLLRPVMEAMAGEGGE